VDLKLALPEFYRAGRHAWLDQLVDLDDPARKM